MTRGVFVQETHKMQRDLEMLAFIKHANIAPTFYHIESAGTDPEVTIEGKPYLMFASNNYLGLSTRPEVIEQAWKGLEKHGLGPGGSRFLCGNIIVLEELDCAIADLVGMEDAITFPTGYMANAAIFKALLDPLFGPLPYRKGAAVIFSDEYNHGTIVDGCRLSYAQKVPFKHNDVNDLSKKLKMFSARNPKMIVTEGVFTPDGELSPLPEIVALAEQYRAILMVDDAHGVGVLGHQGGGTVEHFGLHNGVDIIMGSFDKALGGVGGFLAGKREIIEYLRIVARPYVFSSAVPGVLASGLIESIRLCKEETQLRTKLFQNASYLRTSLNREGFRIMGTEDVPVVPVFLGDERRAIVFAEKLFENGVFSPSFRWPAVPKGKSRIRVTPMATHSETHLRRAVQVFKKVGKELGVI